MMGLVIISGMADEGGVHDYAADLVVGTRDLELESLTALNKSATNYYVQLFNIGFTASARNCSASAAVGSIVHPFIMDDDGGFHRFLDGDYVTFGGALVALGSGYVRTYKPGQPDGVFQVFDTLAHALNRATQTGQITWASGSGTVQIANSGYAPLIPEEMPLLGTGSSPSNVISYLNGRFRRGLYVRAVTAINGSTLGGADVKFTARYRYKHGA